MNVRPYSSDELVDLERDILLKHRLSDVVASHVPCLHKYRVKRGGRKEQHILDYKDAILDDQTCSVCFKIRTSHDEKRYPDEITSKNDVDDLDTFYKWLYRHDY